MFLQVPGNEDLLHFSLPGPSVVEKDTSGQLHGDRTAALCDLPFGQCRHECAHDRLIIDAVVLIEVLVLYTDHGLLEHVRYLIAVNIVRVLLRQGL